MTMISYLSALLIIQHTVKLQTSILQQHFCWEVLVQVRLQFLG